ncbi:MAG: hypothetical protein QM784_09220 [Polyangiaceae bacterium]
MKHDLSTLNAVRVLACGALLWGCATDANWEDTAKEDTASEGTANEASAALVSRAPSARATKGALDGVRTWIVPDTPNGLVSNQSWFSVGSAPDGAIYVTTNDHTTNSAMFRLPSGSDVLRYVGDARAASEAVDNWLPGETAEKFHVRPIWYRDRVYVATADYSNQDDLYLQRRGFHFYAYDERSRDFLDLSASEPNGVAAEHISIFSSAMDEKRGFLYALGSPTAHLYQYDIATGKTVDLGRPDVLTRKYYNPGRFLWVDSRGRVYFTVGTAGTLMPGEPATPTYVLYWDPVTGWGERTDWRISEMLRTGQWSWDKKRCYILDYPLNLYRFDDETGTFTKLGQGQLPSSHVSTRTGAVRVRSMQLSPNEQKIYLLNDSAPVNSLFEWDFRRTMTPLELATEAELDPKLTPAYTGITGHDSWDDSGRFYFTSFGGEGVPATPNVMFVGVDPVRLKTAVGVLPGIASVKLEHGFGHAQWLHRRGDRSVSLDVLLETRDGRARKVVHMPAGRPFVLLERRDWHEGWRVIPDGDTYLVDKDHPHAH